MSGTWGAIAKKELGKRGLLYFKEVVDDIRALQRADVRAVLAVAAAHCLSRRRTGRGEPDAVDRECAAAVDSMWGLLTASGSNSVDRSWLKGLRGSFGPDVVDRDLVACTLYAADALGSDDAAAAARAVSRLVDDRFSSLESATASRARATGVEEFVRDCASPQVQSVLRRLRAASQTLLESGVSPQTVTAVRHAFDAC
jgi:hypothetical protein